ncbi:MAG: MGMT family protein [Actinomycetes bacterium]
MTKRESTADGDERAQRNERILAVIRSLREGEVVTYGDIAEDAGFPKMSRLVGRLLATVDDDLPWWRVVNSSGRLVRGHEREQKALLRGEGVTCEKGRVSRARFGRFSRPARPPAAAARPAARPAVRRPAADPGPVAEPAAADP